jgi:hypothetical protein
MTDGVRLELIDVDIEANREHLKHPVDKIQSEGLLRIPFRKILRKLWITSS